MCCSPAVWEIVQPSLDGERMIALHEPGGFTGEMTMLSGARSQVVGRVSEGGEFLELGPENLRVLVARDADLSEILMRAFILRQLEMIRQGWAPWSFWDRSTRPEPWRSGNSSAATGSPILMSTWIATRPPRNCWIVSK